MSILGSLDFIVQGQALKKFAAPALGSYILRPPHKPLGNMGLFPKLKNYRLSTRDFVLGISVWLALIIFGLFWFAPRWDNPPSQNQVEDKDTKYLGIPGVLSVSCTCPNYVTLGTKRELSFNIHLKLAGKPALNNKAEDLWVKAHAAGSAEVMAQLATADKFITNAEATQNLTVSLEPKDTNLPGIILQVVTTPAGGGTESGVVDSISWPVSARHSFYETLRPFIYASMLFGVLVLALYWGYRKYLMLEQREQAELEEARSRAAAATSEVSPAWEVANVNLQAYFKRNLQQVKHVFWVSVVVMVAGFCCVLAGVYLSFSDLSHVTSPAKVAAISGVITQFIGATFMVIYRSTMAQANQFVGVLDRINSVGMAIKVLDSIPESEITIKNSTRQDLVNLLLKSTPGTEPTRNVPSRSRGKRS